jgi:hypothetical protein
VSVVQVVLVQLLGAGVLKLFQLDNRVYQQLVLTRVDEGL